jgi:DNA-binding NarL/FixJ family response regulator
MGSLGPIYRLLGKGWNDSDIAKVLNLTEVNAQSCVVWLLHFLKMRDRQELVVYAIAAA